MILKNEGKKMGDHFRENLATDETVLAAINGDSEAIYTIIEDLKPFMYELAHRTLYDKNGKKYMENLTIERLVDLYEIKLVQTIQGFKPQRDG